MTHFDHLGKEYKEKYKNLLDVLERDYDKIVEEINVLVDSNYTELLTLMSASSKGCLDEDGLLPIYKLVDDGCPWDHSGELEYDGSVDPSKITLYDFLLECYTGDKEPTFESGCGWHWLTYADMLSECTRDYSTQYLFSVLSRYIPELFDHELFDWINEVFYEDTKVYDYFSIDPFDASPIHEEDLNMSVSDFLSIYEIYKKEQDLLNKNDPIFGE